MLVQYGHDENTFMKDSDSAESGILLEAVSPVGPDDNPHND